MKDGTLGDDTACEYISCFIVYEKRLYRRPGTITVIGVPRGPELIWSALTVQDDAHSMTVFTGIAELERDLIRERTGAGREAAKQRGVRFGRPRKLNTDQARVATRLLPEGKPVRDIARTFNVHEATIYRLAAASDAA